MKRPRFTNLDGTGPHAFSSVMRWAVWDRLRGARRSSPARADVPAVRPDLDALLEVPAVGARITWIGHASWLVQLDGVSLLVDPVLSDSLGPGVRRNVPPALTAAELPTIDAQLVTHNHRDHLDLPSLRVVNRPVIAGTGHAPFFASNGLPCTELGWWEETRIGDVSIRFVPSQHWSQRGIGDTNEALWGGFVITGNDARIYHSGDTAYFEGFAEIGRRVGPIDAAILPIGAYDPAWFMSKQHMNPEEAARAFGDLGARDFYAMHWGTFKLTDEPLDEPPERLRVEWSRLGLAPDRCHVLPIGGAALVRSPPPQASASRSRGTDS